MPRAKTAPALKGLRPESSTRRNVEQDRRRAEEGPPVFFGDLASEAIVGGDPLRLTRVASPNCIGSLLRPARDALSLGLPIFQILAAPRFAPLPILARTARAFHLVRGSKGQTAK